MKIKAGIDGKWWKGKSARYMGCLVSGGWWKLVKCRYIIWTTIQNRFWWKVTSRLAARGGLKKAFFARNIGMFEKKWLYLCRDSSWKGVGCSLMRSQVRCFCGMFKKGRSWKGEADYGSKGTGGWIGFRLAIPLSALRFNAPSTHPTMSTSAPLSATKKGCSKSWA